MFKDVYFLGGAHLQLRCWSKGVWFSAR